uniref:Uncharacterized protein n=1 Tax=Cyanothece sp. (strain PCC 7425 / ATCC 29141) TaxID=395961 RepID=B8HUR6_CYAP4
MEYEVKSAIAGRIRIKVPRLAHDPDYAGKLKGLVDGINGVYNCQINPAASSILIEYFCDGNHSTQAMAELLVGCIDRANGVATLSKVVAPPPQEKSTSGASAAVTPPVPEVQPQASLPEEPAGLESTLPFPLETVTESVPEPVAEVAISESESEVESVAEEVETATAEMETSLEAEVEQEAPLAIASSEDTQEEDETEDETDDEADDEDEPAGLSSLSQGDLAKRLGVVSQSLSPRRTKPDFPEWSRSKDPEGIAWQFDSQQKVFYPLSSSSDPN